METFSSTSNKLYTIWNRVKKNSNNITSEEEWSDLISQHSLNKKILTLYDSGWQAIAIGRELPNVYKTVLTGKDTITLHDVPYFFRSSQLSLLEQWVPYLKYEIRVKTQPGTELTTVERYNIVNYQSKKYKITVGGTQTAELYDIPFYKHLYSDDDIDDESINGDCVKKVWSVTGHYTNRFYKKYNITPSSAPCGAYEDYYEDIIDYDDSSQRITSLSKVQVVGIGSRLKHEYKDLGSGCEEVVTYLKHDEVIISALDGGKFSFDDDTPSYTVSGSLEELPIDSGYWLYHGTNKVPPRVGQDEFTDWQLPASNLGEIIYDPNVVDDESAESTLKYYSRNQDLGIIKPIKGEDIYQVQASGRICIKAKATQKNEFSLDYPKYTFTYPYIINETEETETLDFIKYSIPDQDIQIKLVVTLQNPFYFSTEYEIQS